MRTYNIIVIDDSEIDLELLALVVSELPNVNVIKFQSSTDAVNFFSSEPRNDIDLVLCDYEMPKLNGLQILVTLRKQNIQVPFIFITAFATLELANTCKHEGATGFVVKPYVSYELQDKIQKILKSTLPQKSA